MFTWLPTEWFHSQEDLGAEFLAQGWNQEKEPHFCCLLFPGWSQEEKLLVGRKPTTTGSAASAIPPLLPFLHIPKAPLQKVSDDPREH